MDDLNEKAIQLAEQINEQETKAKAMALTEIASNPEKAVNTKLSLQIANKIDTDEKINKIIDDTANKVIDNAVETTKNNVEKNTKKAIFENNESACQLIGVNEETTPKWVIKCAKGVQAFLYAIWIIVAFFTVAPIVFLGMKIKIILKNTWLAMLVAILIYIGGLTLPILLKMLQNI